MDDRRQSQRQNTTIVVELESPDGKRGTRVGITRDASSGGLLVGCSSRYDVGQELVLVFQRSPGSPQLRARCEVVRVERNPSPSSAFWLYLMGVRFLEQVPNLDQMIEDAIVTHRAVSN